MDDLKKEFLKEIFSEAGAHIRTTERKSLILTGAYIGMFSIFLSSIAKTCLSGSPIALSWVSVAIQLFFLLIGTCIFVMQQWYRAWKEHYLKVSLHIRREFMDDNSISNEDKFLPYWLRGYSRDSKISVDNLLKLLTVIINFIIVVLISYQVLELLKNRSLSIIIIILMIALYIVIVGLTQYKINKKKKLFA